MLAGCSLTRRVRAGMALGVAAGLAGCGGDARVEMAAADALDRVANEMTVAYSEYHAEVERYDAQREADVTAAFIARIRRDQADEDKCQQHGREFAAALAKIRTDRGTEAARIGMAGEQVAAVREIGRGLRNVGIASLSLQDEMRRYLMSTIEAYRKAQAAGVPASMPAALRGLVESCTTCGK